MWASMQVKDTTVKVRVPATTANMGPGFDSFGMAFRYYDEVTARPISGHTRVYAKDEGAGASVPGDDGNLIVRTLRVGLETAGLHQSGFELHCTNRIPQGGGLGSSAAAIVAGLMLARGFAEDESSLDDHTIFSIATAFEGHPDNVAPAVFGGATVAWMDDKGKPQSAPMPVDATQPVTLFAPPIGLRLATEKARAVLPNSIPREDAVFNTCRAAVLMLALNGRRDLLMEGTEDRLHQDYRRGVLPETMKLIDRLRAEGHPAVISGAGPTVLVLGEVDEDAARAASADGWRMLTPGIDTKGAKIQ